MQSTLFISLIVIKNMNVFSKKYWERDFIDLWSVVHFNNAVVFSFIPFGLNISFTDGLMALLVIAILWEFYEIMRKIKETRANRFLDVFVATIGFVLVYNFMPPFSDDPLRFLWISLPFTVFAIVLLVIAWSAYKQYTKL